MKVGSDRLRLPRRANIELKRNRSANADITNNRREHIKNKRNQSVMAKPKTDLPDIKKEGRI